MGRGGLGAGWPSSSPLGQIPVALRVDFAAAVDSNRRAQNGAAIHAAGAHRTFDDERFCPVSNDGFVKAQKEAPLRSTAIGLSNRVEVISPDRTSAT